MATNLCPDCKRRYSSARNTCPSCGALSARSGGNDSSSSRTRLTLAGIVVLGALSGYLAMTRETGPPAEVEALHSPGDAIVQCLEGIESRFSDRDGRVEGLLDAEYLQGGEYEVRGSVSVMEGRQRTTGPVLCEAQFRPENGWTIEHIELGS